MFTEKLFSLEQMITAVINSQPDFQRIKDADIYAAIAVATDGAVSIKELDAALAYLGKDGSIIRDDLEESA